MLIELTKIPIPNASNPLQHYLRISLNSGPVNALSRALLVALAEAISSANLPDSHVQGILLTSSLSKVFSAGLDLTELVLGANTPATAAEYLAHFQRVVFLLASSAVPVVAVVNGAAPAGGTVLALVSDYKIASRDCRGFMMGLIETRVGMNPPIFLHTLARGNLVNARTAERVLQLGSMFTSPDECVSLGFLDEVVETAGELESRAIEVLEEYRVIPWNARVGAKLGARQQLLKEMQEAKPGFRGLETQEFQETVKGTLVMLKMKKGSKYMIAQNRPYNSTDVFTNLHSKIGKTLVGKILDKLVEEKEITGKAFGKTMVYFANQDASDVPSTEEMREMDLQIASLKEEAAALKAENSAKEKALTSLLNTAKTADLQAQLDQLDAENEKLEERLQALRSGTRKLTVEDKNRADKKLDANRKEWRVRRKYFKDAWNMMNESMTRQQANDILEEIGIETDEMVGVDFDKDPLDGLM
ncbi:PSMC3 interacting protein [Rhizoclosmatium sp. JEL0117]|nr:PSMC3 interacting protein [Rhizoclosmatium sp. JEL0117]